MRQTGKDKQNSLVFHTRFCSFNSFVFGRKSCLYA